MQAGHLFYPGALPTSEGKAMSKVLIQFASEWCANYRNGTCNGLNIEDDGSTTRFVPPGKPCVLPKRCTYFEQCVAPAVESCEAVTVKQRKYKETGFEALREYRLSNNVASAQMNGNRKCPDCGRPIMPRCQLCAECAQRRQSERNRKRTIKPT